MPHRDPSIQVCVIECGAKCCRNGEIVITTDEKRRMNEVKQMTLTGREDGHWLYSFKGKDCAFLKDNRCIIYDQRPKHCAGFPFFPTTGCLVWPRFERGIPQELLMPFGKK